MINANDVKQKAYGNWKNILSRLGVDDSYLIKGKHTPCPICNDGTDRYKFDDKTVNLAYYCNQCGYGSGIDLLMGVKNIPFAIALQQVANVINNEAVHPIVSKVLTGNKKKLIVKSDINYVIVRILNSLSYAPSLPAKEYYQKRGLDKFNSQEVKSIRYGKTGYRATGMLFDRDTKKLKMFDAIVGQLGYWNDLQQAIVTIYLNPQELEEHKKPKQTIIRKPMFKAMSTVSGMGVWLSDKKAKTLHVVEGLENALSIAVSLKTLSVVSTVTAPLMGSLVIPDHVENVTIWVDGDTAGTEAGKKLEKRYSGTKNIKIISPEHGKDWNDVLLSLGSDAIVEQLKENIL